MYAKDIMTKNVFTVSAEDTVEHCAKILLENTFSGLPVTDENDKLVGIVTEGDLIKRVAHFKVPAVLELLGGLIYLDNPNKYMDDLKRAMAEKVGDMMSKDIISIKANDSIEDTATLMMQKQIKRLPVVDLDGKLIGIISRRDIMAHLYPISKN